MKRKILLLVGLLILGLQAVAATFSFNFDGEGFISDGAGVINISDKRKIDYYLDYVKTQTSYSVFVVTLDALNGVPASKAAQVVSEHVKTTNNRDNVLVFLVSPTEGKIGVDIGENLKSEISYITLKNIIQEEVSPAFKNGDYSKAITNGIYNISRMIEPSLVFVNTENNQKPNLQNPKPSFFANIEKKYLQGAIVAFFGLIWFFWRLKTYKGIIRQRRGGFGNHFNL